MEPQPLPANLPAPRRDRPTLIAALSVLVAGATILVLALGSGGRERPLPPPPPIVLAVPAPVAAAAAPLQLTEAQAIVQQRPGSVQQQDQTRFTAQPRTHISAGAVAGFYPVYTAAARAFNVNWLLLASIHAQETAFSTDPTTYSGLNFAHCCGGPMQFNITNGPPSTWDRVKDAYRYGPRPSYVHVAAQHPSLYDDFDSIMAAARLLSSDGAGPALDAGAWGAAYSYYGHDPTGITYADQVLARAIGWSQNSFCVNCPINPRLLAAVHTAYGAPVAAPARARAKIATAGR